MRTKSKFPATVAALQILQNDAGGNIGIRALLSWNNELPKIERALAKLSRRQDVDGFSELDRFVCGDSVEQRNLLRRFPSLRIAHKFLNAIFKSM